MIRVTCSDATSFYFRWDHSVVQGGGMTTDKVSIWEAIPPCVMASLSTKQGVSFAFCLMPIPELAGLEASPVFLASAALKLTRGPVMHHNSSSLWERRSNVSFPGGFSSIGLWLLQWQSYWCLLESTPRGPCWWTLWINAREFFSVKAAFIYWMLNIHNCCGSVGVLSSKGYQDPPRNRPLETEMAPPHGWLSQLPLFFTRPCCSDISAMPVSPALFSMGHSWYFAPLCCCRL